METDSSPIRKRVPFILGLSLLGLVLAADLCGLSDAAPWSRVPRIVFSLAGIGLLGWGLYRWVKSGHTLDERFLVHRLKASRAALVSGMVSMAVWLASDVLVDPPTVRWQLIGILAVMGLTKVAAMVYYRRTE